MEWKRSVLAGTLHACIVKTYMIGYDMRITVGMKVRKYESTKYRVQLGLGKSTNTSLHYRPSKISRLLRIFISS